jgi:hypothetical protein
MAASRREQPYRRVLQIGGAVIQVDIRIGQGSLRNEDIVAWVRRATEAVAVYYGRFPVQRARVIVGQSEEKDESIHGTTWGDVQGVQGLTRMRLGSAVTEAKLEEDWTMTHELVHMALSSLPDESHWPEEGIATYVEPIARTQAGQLPVEQVWAGMVRGRPHVLGRRDVLPGRRCPDPKGNGNRKGLQDALQAIVAAQDTIDTEWPLSRVLETGDRATGTTVLVDLYRKWKDAPIVVDLDQLWQQLGVRVGSRGIELDANAPLVPTRRAMTSPPKQRLPSRRCNLLDSTDSNLQIRQLASKEHHESSEGTQCAKTDCRRKDTAARCPND